MKKNATKKDQKKIGLYPVEGLGAVRDYLRFKPSAVKFIVYSKSSQRELIEKLSPTCSVLSSASVEEEQKLSRASVWAAVSVELYSEKNFFSQAAKSSKGLVVALDHVTDPRNLGAIVRSAAFFGVRFVVVPKDRQVHLTSSSVVTAQAGFALTDLVVVTNLARTLEKLKQEGYWILGTSVESGQVVSKENAFDKSVLVLGSEEKGMSPLVKKACDLQLCISSAEKSVESLNISVAAGILIQQIILNSL